MVPFNQTRVELKLVYLQCLSKALLPFNQTRVELKREWGDAIIEKYVFF